MAVEAIATSEANSMVRVLRNVGINKSEELNTFASPAQPSQLAHNEEYMAGLRQWLLNFHLVS